MFYDSNIWFYITIGLMLFWLVYFVVKRIKCNFFAFFYFSIMPYVFQQRNYHQIFFKYVSVPLLFLIIASLIYKMVVKKKKIYLSGSGKTYIIFLLYIIVSGLVIGANENFYIGIRNIIFFSVSIFSLYTLLSEDDDGIQRAAQINVIFLFICAILDTAIFYSIYHFTYRASGPLIGMNEFAQIAILYLFFATSNHDKKNRRDIILSLITLGTIILSGSNGGLVAILLWIIVSSKLLKPVSKYIIKGVIIVIVSGMLCLIGTRICNPDLFTRLFSSQSDRILLWSIFLNVFKSSPVFGLGYNMVNSIAYKYVYDMGAIAERYSAFISRIGNEGSTLAAHNDFVKILSETGLIGAIIFSALLFGVFKICMRLPKKNQALFISFIVFFFVHNILQDSRIWMFLFAVTVYSKNCNFVHIREKELAIKWSRDGVLNCFGG